MAPRSAGATCLLQAGGLAWADENKRHTVLHGAWLADSHELVGRVNASSPVGGSFDLRLLEAIGQRARLDFSLQRMDPADVAAAFASGRLDFALPARRGDGPAEGAQLSHPYGVRNDVLVCNPHLKPLPAEGVAALKEAVARDWRIAVSAGKSYGSDPDALLAEGHDRGHVRWVESNLDLVETLLAGETTCVLAPRLELMVALTQRRPGETFIEHQRIFLSETRLQILFNTATVDAATIASIDRALQELQADGTVAELQRSAVRPTLLAFAVATVWFSWFDIIGTIAFALSGVLIARAEGFSLLGAFVLAALPAVGGGVLRDLLVGREPIGIVASPLPLTLVAATVAAAYVLYALHDRLEAPAHKLVARLFGAGRWPRFLSFHTLLELTDAIGLAAFTVLGVVIAVRAGAEPLWLWGPLCAAISGAGGGILRDILRVGYNNPALRTSFYAEVCVVWGFLLSLAVLYLLTEEDAALLRISILVTVLGALATRLLVVAFKVRSPRF
ncbi:hypothetical protein BAL199_14397 [alpha proteobacterium BAL199]|nr:hypothetical protein BAL199_14397 [alpha proteobacterium BAL199]